MYEKYPYEPVHKFFHPLYIIFTFQKLYLKLSMLHMSNEYLYLLYELQAFHNHNDAY